MTRLPLLTGDEVWVPEAWTVWTHAGVRYHRGAFACVFAEHAGSRFELTVTRAGAWAWQLTGASA